MIIFRDESKLKLHDLQTVFELILLTNFPSLTSTWTYNVDKKVTIYYKNDPKHVS